MCAPTRNTSCCKKRSIKLTRNIKKAVKKSAVKIDICGNALIDFTLSADNLRSQSFNSLIKIKFIIVTFGKRKLFNSTFKNYLTRVRNCINCVSHTIDKTFFIKNLLVKELFKIIFKSVLVFPVLNMLFEILKHIVNLNICTAVLRTFE